MGFLVGVGSSGNARLSWSFGDTPLYRFVFDIPSDAQLPPGTMFDFSIRTPNGVKVCNLTKHLEMPMGNLPYFELFISPTLSYNIPPGNYVFTLALKRPYGGEGNYRYTPFPTGNVTVGGIQSLLPENIVDLDGHTDPPPAIELRIDARPFITRMAANINIPSLPDTAPSVTLAVQTVPANPTNINPVTETTLVASITKGTHNITGNVIFRKNGVDIGSVPALPYATGGVVTYIYDQSYNADAIFSAHVTDGNLNGYATASVAIGHEIASPPTVTLLIRFRKNSPNSSKK